MQGRVGGGAGTNYDEKEHNLSRPQSLQLARCLDEKVSMKAGAVDLLSGRRWAFGEQEQGGDYFKCVLGNDITLQTPEACKRAKAFLQLITSL